MLFNSFQFILFFLIVVVLYYTLAHKYRWILLLIGSYYFYMCWNPALIVLIVFSTFINYFCALLIYRQKRKQNKKNILLVSLFINFGLLFLFKYFMLLNQTFMDLYATIGSFLLSLFGNSPEETATFISGTLAQYPLRQFDIILPMGISFYTFQAASYTIDVYRQKIKPVRHYGIFSLFITFFPQLVAGPIERSENLIPQFYKKHYFRGEAILSGLKLMLLGFFKKIVIADRVAIAVNTVFQSPEQFGGLSLTIAAILFAFQIYCDFSGYSDIATGSAKVLGFQLMMNFDKPYLSKSIKEFWRRWHVSLSTWFMDYVYIPLGGSRQGKWKQYRNLFLTFLISGLWHGSSWNFVIWGGIHGIYQVIGLLTLNIRNRFKEFLHISNSRILSVISILITFTLVCVALIFFRADTITDAIYIITHLLDGVSNWGQYQVLYDAVSTLGINLYECKVVLFAIGVLMLSEVISGKDSVFGFWEKKPYVLRLLYYVFIGAIVLSTGVFYNAGEFIYFQF